MNTTITDVAVVPEQHIPDSDSRGRFVDAMAAVVRKQGLRDTTIADIVSEARTSRRTFYEHFQSKEECYVALMQRESDRIAMTIAGAVDPHAQWDVQLAQAVEGWITAQAAQPELMLSWIRETRLLGEQARVLERDGLDRLVILVQALVDTNEMRAGGLVRPSADVALVLLAGLSELFAHTVEDGRDPMTIVPVGVAVARALLTLPV